MDDLVELWNRRQYVVEGAEQKVEMTRTVFCDLCDAPMRCEEVSECRWELLRCENQRCRAVRHVYRKEA